MLLYWFVNLLFLIKTTTYAKRVNILDYCAQHPRNTPCMFDCRRSSRCGITHTSYEHLNTVLREVVVQAHNTKRALVAAGHLQLQAPRLHQFNPVSYDKECEFIAGCYVKQCRNHPDKLRISYDGTRLGQNRYVLSMKRGTHHHSGGRKDLYLKAMVLTSAIASWFNPGVLLSEKYYVQIHKSYTPIIYPQRAATFTQLVWEKTIYVGCAFMHSVRDAKWDMYEVICNYKPQGNILGQKVYELENANSSCEPMPFDDAKMCAEKIRDPIDDNYIPPFSLNMAGITHCQNSLILHFTLILTISFLH